MEDPPSRRVKQKRRHSQLPHREVEICRRIAAARALLGIDQAEAARKIGIPKSTLSNYELCVVPLKASLALRLCRHLIISEEWLATGEFLLATRAGLSRGVGPGQGMDQIYMRQCMDLMGSAEAEALRPNALFSEAFDRSLRPVYERRIFELYYGIGIPSSAWSGTNPELGRDILNALVDRFMLLIGNEALRRGVSPETAKSTYLGFMLRMSLFGFNKCMEVPVTAGQVGLPLKLFEEAGLPILAFGQGDCVAPSDSQVLHASGKW